MSFTAADLNELLTVAGFEPRDRRDVRSAEDATDGALALATNPYDGLPARLDEHKFREEYQEVIRMKALGYKTIDIARALHLGMPTVQRALTCPFGRQLLADLQDARNGSVMDITERVRDMADDAADYLERVMSGDEPATAGLKFKVAESILDRAGHGRITKNLNIGLNGTLSNEEIIRCREQARASGILTVKTEEVSPTGLETERAPDCGDSGSSPSV